MNATVLRNSSTNSPRPPSPILENYGPTVRGLRPIFRSGWSIRGGWRVTTGLHESAAIDFVLVLEQLESQGWARLKASPGIYRSLQELVSVADSFFERPLSEKLKFDIRGSVGHRGYVPTTERGYYTDEGERRYEAFDIGRKPLPTDLAMHPLRGPNVWPPIPSFAEVAERHFAAMQRLVSRIGCAICEYLEVPVDEFERLRTEPITQLRLIRYLAPEVVDVRDHLKPAMGAHTDYEFFTLLFETEPGIQVLDRSGRWIEPSLGPDSVIMLCGDVLEVFSGGRFVSTLHRTSGNVAAGRMSIPFFCGADFDAKICPRAGEGRPPLLFGDHMMRQLRRDFPYLRVMAADPNRAGDPLIDLTEASAPPQRSPFELRRLAAEHAEGAAAG